MSYLITQDAGSSVVASVIAQCVTLCAAHCPSSSRHERQLHYELHSHTEVIWFNSIFPPLYHLDRSPVCLDYSPPMLVYFYISHIQLQFVLAMYFRSFQSFLSEFLAVSRLLNGFKNLSVQFALIFGSPRNKAERVEEILKLLEKKNKNKSQHPVLKVEIAVLHTHTVAVTLLQALCAEAGSSPQITRHFSSDTFSPRLEFKRWVQFQCDFKVHTHKIILLSIYVSKILQFRREDTALNNVIFVKNGFPYMAFNF